MRTMTTETDSTPAPGSGTTSIRPRFSFLHTIAIGMTVWTTVVTVVVYLDLRRWETNESMRASGGGTVSGYLTSELPGYAILWAIGMTSMTLLRFRVRRYLASLETANARLAADSARSERAEAIAAIGHWELDLKHKTFRGSPGARTIYGLAGDMWDAATVQSIPLPRYRKPLDDALSGLIAGTGPYDIEFEIRRPSDGSLRRIHSIAVYDPSRATVTGVIHDVTERHAAHRSLRESEKRYRLLADNVNDMIWTTDLQGRFTYVSPSVQLLRGYTPEEVLGTTLDEAICPPSRHVVTGEMRRLLGEIVAGGDPVSAFLEVEQPCADGSTIWTETTARVTFDETGAPTGLIGVTRDITSRRRDREELKVSLRDKEVLLREVHHRVKNNLQVICSLLNLQAESAGDPHTRTILKESQQRIRSMALVHEKLYRSEHFSSIDFADYLGSMTREMMRSIDPGSVRLKLDCDRIYLDIERAIPAGMIVTELLTNAFKHAFPDRPGGAVTITVRGDGDTCVVMTVADDGVGLPPHLDIASSRSTGMVIIHGLTRQLDGELTVDGTGGTSFRVRFPAAPSA